MTMTQLRSTLMALASAGLLTSTAAPVIAAEINWDMPNEYNATSIHAEGDKHFTKALAEKTDGAIEITHHFGGALGYKSVDQFDAVADGAVPIADTYVGPLGGIDPMFLLSSLPFLAKTIDQARVLWEVARPHYEKIFEDNNQKLLYASPWPPSGIWAKKPVTGEADLSGLRIRTYDANGTITLKEAGAAPIQLSWADVIPQLNTGGIDAVLTSAEGGVAAKFWEHLDHFTEINYASPLNMTHINLDVFNSLTEEQQKAVLEAAQSASERNWEAVKIRRENNYKTMRENGMTVVTDVPDEFLAMLAEAGEVALDDWLDKTGETGRQIVEEYRSRTGSS